MRVPGRGSLLLALLLVGCSRGAAPVDMAANERDSYDSYDSGSMGTQARRGGGFADAARTSATARSDDALRQAWWREYSTAIGWQAQALLGRHDARSQLAAALLLSSMLPSGDDPAPRQRITEQRAAALTRAGQLDPDDVLTAWMEALQCPQTVAPCAPAAALQRLQRLEPDNAAVWLLAIDAAQARGDGAAIDRLLERAGASGYYDLHWGDASALLDAALGTVPMPPRGGALETALRRAFGSRGPVSDADLRGVSVLGVTMAFALPDLGPVSRACGGRNGGAPTGSRAPTCIAALAPMARSDVLVARFVALTRQVQLTAGTSAGAAWREQLRNLYWIQYAGSRALGRQTPPGYAQSVWVDGEIAALQAVLQHAGQPATAPPGWLPADARGRALVTTGQPPPGG